LAVLAVLLSLTAAKSGDADADVPVLFHFGASGRLHLGAKLALGSAVEFDFAFRGGLPFDEGDAERQMSGQRAVAENSATRSASGTSSISQCRGSTSSDKLRGRIA
jgi:hypothetical protein